VFDGIARLSNTPGILVHGRYDVSGPLETAWRLHQYWPATKLVIVDDAGHGGRNFATEFVAAIDQMRYLL
jgi:proline iminopeptidase